ncbi:MAG: DEAD/DEAH box helicase [Bacilli bacterium]|nr:DEAD/DEAH box helicase [Bacilli bacterium]
MKLSLLFLERRIKMLFTELKLKRKLMQGIKETGYVNLTPIQEKAIPHIINNKDVLACAQTGTGKTAAFAVPIIESLLNNSDNKGIKALIITPTRELAMQIRDNFRMYGKYTNLKTSVVVGGANVKSQIKVLKEGVDILVATPGRLLDLMSQRVVKTHSIKTVVLDEADTMLDMGFINDVKKILAKIPSEHQTLLFSATMPTEIRKLGEELLKNHVSIQIDTISSPAPLIDQSVYFVDKKNKFNLLLDLFKKQEIKSLLIFTRTKIGADKLARLLNNYKIPNEVIHGGKEQRKRTSALRRFKTGKTNILIATDVAAHGLDITGLSHVINYDLPSQAEVYVHRIGRTGRAGEKGIAISFCDNTQVNNLNSIESLIKGKIRLETNHDYHLDLTKKSKPKYKNFKNKKKPYNKKRVR